MDLTQGICGLAVVAFLLNSVSGSDQDEHCHESLSEGWKQSFCVSRKQLRECKIDLYYRLSKTPQQCGKKRRCCAFRKQLPPINSDKCGLTYYQEGYRIIDGEPSKPGQWPWAVSIEFGSRSSFWGKSSVEWTHQCGGVLIGNSIVLTAAHCFKDFTNTELMRVVLGRHKVKNSKEMTRRYVNVKLLQTHEKFTQKPKKNDIAIILLDEEVERTKYIQPICLPSADYRKAKRGFRQCYIMGWGLTDKKRKRKAAQLRHAEVSIFRESRCRKKYSGDFHEDSQMCAGVRGKKVDACQGDSGGALACLDVYSNWQITGIISWGKGCGQRDMPGIYTAVHSYKSWIKKKIHDLNGFYPSSNNFGLPANLTQSQEHATVVFGE